MFLNFLIIYNTVLFKEKLLNFVFINKLLKNEYLTVNQRGKIWINTIAVDCTK